MTSPTQTSAIAFFQQQLAAWGIPSLVADASKLVKQGLDNDSITLALRNTDAYKKRFAANALRLKKGLPELSPAEYIANEAAYAQVRRQFGLMQGFYDSKDETDQLIAADVSPAEWSQRVQDAQVKYMLGPAENRDWWRQHFGGTDAEAIAAILDPQKAIPLMEQRLQQAAIGGAALRQGLQVSTTRAGELAAAGVTDDQANKGFADIAQALPTETAIAQRFGDRISQAEEEAATFGTAGAADALEKRRRLQASEQGLFAGKSAADTSSLSRSTVGSY